MTAAIDGVRLLPLHPHVDARGSLTEVLRSDWPGSRFAQATVTINAPGVIRGWHGHRLQTDLIIVVHGEALIALFDDRPGSPTHGTLAEYVGRDGPRFGVFVPPGVLHGYRTIGSEAAVILNFPDRLYDPADPDEQRVPHDDPAIAYSWEPSSA